MNTQKLILAMVILICLALITSPTTASNENLTFPSYNQIIEIRPEIGSTQGNGVVGQYGYKVFYPGAIAVIPIVAIQSPTNPLLYRSGSTDAWLDFGMGPGNIMGWNHFGGHQSGSDL